MPAEPIAQSYLTWWQRKTFLLAAVLLVGLGLLLRLTGLNWDAGALLHPDERYLVMVTAALQWPDSVAQYFNSAESPLNPLNLQDLNWYVYGTLPLFLAKLWVTAAGATGLEEIAVSARLLTAIIDSATLLAVFGLGRQVFGLRVGLLAAVFYGLAVLPVQLAHFFTVDPFLNLFLLLALLQAVRMGEAAGPRPALLLGLWWGCALASKLSALAFAPVVLAAVWLGGRQLGRGLALQYLTLSLFCAALVFRLLQPYAFSGWFSPDPRFLSALEHLQALQAWDEWMPPSVQWLGRNGLQFPLHNMALWGLGLPLFVAALAGAALAGARLWRQPRSGPALLLLALLVQFAVVGLGAHPTLRYFLPAYPLLVVFAAHYLLALKNTGVWRYGPILLVLIATLVWALAFSAIYRAPSTRIDASQWIQAHIAPTAVLGVEHWDDALPLTFPVPPPAYYQQVTLPVTDPATEVKREQLLAGLAQVDYLVISSQRGYASMTRLPKQFPLVARYYQLLFGGLAGFELVAQFSSYPQLAGTVVRDERAEEAFTVYDHPRVFIFAKSDSFSQERLRAELAAVALPASAGRLEPGTLTLSEALHPVTSAELLSARDGEILHLLHWLLLLVLLGLVGNALCRRLWPGSHLPGRSLVLALGAWIFAAGLNTGLWGNQSGGLMLLLLLVSFAALILYRGGPRARAQVGRAQEIVFWLTFSFFLLLRAHNPAIEWGERPMDFAILNAFLRADTVPPVDPWFAGEQLHYHAWGQFLMALLGRLAGTPPAILYNLAAALTPALAAELFFWVLWQLTAGERQRLWPAVVGTLLVLFAGNLSFWLYLPASSATSFTDFWQASRIVPGAINEFPFWTSVFADLHSHFLGMVFSALFLAGLVLWHRGEEGETWIATAGLLALALASLALTNSWALPVYAMVLLVVVLVQGQRRRMVQAALVSLAAVLLVLPFWSMPERALRISDVETPVTLFQGLILFGPFFATLALWSLRGQAVKRTALLLLAAAVTALVLGDLRGLALGLLVLLLVRLYPQPRTPASEMAGVLAICGLLVIVGSEFFVVSDRMNTVFKYQYEAWILLALASAVALAELASNRWQLLSAALVLLLGLPTSGHCRWAWWHNPRMPPPELTLDGLAYLNSRHPSEALAVAWLQRNVTGQSAILEAVGPRYGRYARFSAFTGLPAWLGWDYHVWQHGHDNQDIAQRERQVAAAYTTLAGAEAIAALGVRYAMRCTLEWDTYGASTGKYWTAAGWRPVFSAPDCEIWEVSR